MKSDAELALIYSNHASGIGGFDYISLIDADEESLQAKMNIFNKKKLMNDFIDKCKNYFSHLNSEWSQIYSDANEAEQAIKGEIWIKNRSPFAKTGMQLLVEQYFYSLARYISITIGEYESKFTKEQASKLKESIKKYLAQLNLKFLEHTKQGALKEEIDKIRQTNPSGIRI